MSPTFTKSDLEIFQIMDFQKRMQALKTQIRPKLESLGEEMAPLLMHQFKQEFFVHTAKHMRRKVNPPDETWVALGPQSRGYKAYVYFALCVGKDGAQARVVMKDECKLRPELGRNLKTNQEFFLKRGRDFGKLTNYLKRDEKYRGLQVRDLKAYLAETSERLVKLKSALFDVGLPLKANSRSLVQEAVEAFDKLFPFYECGLKKGVSFS